MSARGHRPSRGRVMVVGSLVALGVTAALVFAVVRLASENPEEANLGPSVFRFKATRLAGEIEERGPFLLKDPLNRGREVYVQHVGADPATGWVAIRAYASQVSVQCLLRWDMAEERFVDPCTGRRYPADGGGLTTYPARVDDGVVSVDLRVSG